MTSAGTIASRPTVPLRPSPVGRAPQPGGWAARVVIGLFLAAAGVAVTGASWLLLVADDHGRRVDNGLMRAVENHFGSAQTQILDVLHLVSVVSVGLALVVVAGIALVRRRPGAAVAGIALVLLTQVTTQGLKSVLPREGASENSLPSGHVTVITALVVATLLALPPVLRWVAGVAGLVLVAGASVAVMAVGWHRPGDVLAAFGVVAAVGGGLLLIDGVRRAVVGTDRPSAGPGPVPTMRRY
ncbi:phosphatase PAP2 family protein [Actinomycetospora endophytica]|uniref:Phosphatase PAP2 family protein n=1 Tax=Actinomycetospora endophytica TaxID=2291215 RepID=A0ABS8P6Y1_9PSEU|nr:phosphatase PAP2 family protein [Actinomycetospora endophytica]MCD2193879.1 phosphatase PAP2 family protein [Actinomycetospora endophytica]